MSDEMKEKIAHVLKRFAGRPIKQRDPQRIAKVLKVLENVWRDAPDLRLGQIIVSAANLSGRQVVCPAIFHLEDEDLLRGIEELAQRK